MFIAALFTVLKVWKQPKCPSTDKWIKMCILYNGILLSHKKRMKFHHLQQDGWTWRVLC